MINEVKRENWEKRWALFFRFYALILGGILCVLILLVWFAFPASEGEKFSSLEFSRPVAISYLQNALQGRYGSGFFTGQVNSLDISQLEPGDILLGGNPGGAYGHFTHAGLYLGNGEVMEGYVDCGISRQGVGHYRYYAWACVLRVKLPREQRLRAAEYAAQLEGRMFYPTAFKTGGRYWNCTKLIWKAYKEEGIDLDSRHDLWLTPDAIYCSPWVEVISSEGEMPH